MYGRLGACHTVSIDMVCEVPGQTLPLFSNQGISAAGAHTFAIKPIRNRVGRLPITIAIYSKRN